MSEPFEKVDLPSGGWVAFRDPTVLTEGQRRPLKRARTRVGMAQNLGAALRGEINPADLEDSEIDLLEGLVESVALVLTDEWSFDAEISKQGVNDLLPDDYEALLEAAAKHRDVLLPDFSPTPEQTDQEGRENPTGPSRASKTRSAASKPPVSSPTTTSERGGS